MTKQPELKTLVIDKWNGRLTRFRDGDINSGLGNFYATWGCDTFVRSGTLTFMEQATDITKSVITDLVMAGVLRVESGITYMYAIGHNKRLYKIQVNNNTTKNPDYDTPVLVATLANSQTFLYGSSIGMFTTGGAEKLWIGHDAGITSINFDGSGETNYTTTWTPNVPRQQAEFLGKLYVTDGDNLAEIDSSATIVFNKLSPGFPANMQAKDIDISPDGRYLVTTVTRYVMENMVSVAPHTGIIASQPSMLVYWNGTDTGASSSMSFPAFSMTAYQTFSSYNYVFGYQLGGCMFGTPNKVLVVDEFAMPPYPNAVGSSGDFMGWGSTTFDLTSRTSKALLSLYGTIDSGTPVGHYRQLIQSSSLDGGDVVRMPFYTTVSAFVDGGLSSGYTTAPFNLVGTGKTYFSTLEYDGATTAYGFYMFKNVQSYLTLSNTGVYETQHQVFSKKIKPVQVRVYYEPTGALSAGVSFKTDLIGIDGSVLTGGTYTFSASNQITSTSDSAQYPCTVGATPALGLRITNVGSYTPYIHRVEIDYASFGD